jgi:signal transduction histidine kinase
VMSRRWGLQAKMTASYVLVTAAAVVLVEAVVAVLLAALTPGTEPTAQLQLTADSYANAAMQLGARLGRLPNGRELQLGDPTLRLRPGEAELSADGAGVAIPYTPTRQDDAQPMSLALLLDPSGRVVASSYPARYRVGDQIGEADIGAALSKLTARSPADLKADKLPENLGRKDVRSVTAPVYDLRGPGGLEKQSKPPPPNLLGLVYVQIPAAFKFTPPPPLSTTTALVIGALVLAGAVPVGLVFGLLSTRRLIGRLRRLAATTVAVAGGDFRHRLPAAGADEVAQLERNFNRMAERLDVAMAAERQLAGAGERARIARELHDSISQDLFSLHLLAGGLRKALPASSPLQPQVETMERTASQTMNEMQALLLELRPVALEDAGLVPALEELCRAYRDRLGVVVDAELEPVELAPAAEHAVLRVVQEALANAVKHAQPSRIALRLRRRDGQVEVLVSDDGAGFDPAHAGERHGLGLRLMRERVTELGGDLQLDSSPGGGTSVYILLPMGLAAGAPPR